MNLINENYKPLIDTDENIVNNHFWYYSNEEKDFFLTEVMVWQNVSGGAYIAEIGNREIIIPENYHVIIGDIDSGLDAIKMAEVIGRTFEVMTFNIDMEENSWLLEEMTIKGYVEEHEFMFPFLNKMIPVCLGNKRAILVSSNDFYSKLKRMSFGDVV